MLSLRKFKHKGPALCDVLNWSHPVDDGVVLGKDGSLLAGWFYRGDDIAALTDVERNWKTERIARAISRLSGGWASWHIAARLPASSYPDREASHFPDPISRLIDEERRERFLAEGRHYETEHAFVVSYTPPLRHQSKFAELMYDDDAEAAPSLLGSRILDQFKKAIGDLEDSIGDAVRLRRMSGFSVHDDLGREHHQDMLVNFLHFCLTGELVSLNIPSAGAYLDTIIGGKEFWPSTTPRIGGSLDGKFIACIRIQGFPQETYPQILASLDDLAIPYRWSSRMIYLDTHEAQAMFRGYRRKWKQQVRGFVHQVLKINTTYVNEDALSMSEQAGIVLSEASSGLVSMGYYTPVIVLMDPDRDILIENARTVVREIKRLSFAAEIEEINPEEAWLSSLPGHTVPNVRRPPIFSDNLADLLPLSSVWAGEDVHPCPFYPPDSPPLMYASTPGSTPFRVNTHVGDLGHTLVFGPTKAGKSTLLSTVALQALRYPGMTIFAFDKGYSMWAGVNACRGRHYDIGGDDSRVSLAPLSVLDGLSDVIWAEQWIETCFQLQTGKAPSPKQRGEIHRVIELMKSEKDGRTLTHFVAQVQDDDIRQALKYYTLEGTLGGLVDAEHDSIVGSHFVVFEVEHLMGMGEPALIPVLLYLFRVFERSLKGQPAYLILDEAWIMLGNPVFRAKIREWLKVMRKNNCAVVIATQSLSDASRSGILDVLVESCPTKIFLPNEEADVRGDGGPRALYEMMGLNDVQIETIRTATKQRHYYLVSPEGCRLFDLGLGPIALSFVGVSGRADVAHIRRIAAREPERWPYLWLRERGVDVSRFDWMLPQLEEVA